MHRSMPGQPTPTHHPHINAHLSPAISLMHTHTLSFLLLIQSVFLSLSVISLFMFDLFAVLHQLMMVQG